MNAKTILWPRSKDGRKAMVIVYVLLGVFLVIFGTDQLLYTIAGRPGQPVADFVRSVHPKAAGKITFRENLYWSWDTNPQVRIMLEGEDAANKLVQAVEQVKGKCQPPVKEDNNYSRKGTVICKAPSKGRLVTAVITPYDSGVYDVRDFQGFNGGPPSSTRGGASLVVSLSG